MLLERTEQRLPRRLLPLHPDKNKPQCPLAEGLRLVAFCSAALQLFRLNKRDKGQVLSAHNSSQRTCRVTIAADIYRRQVYAGAPHGGDKPDQ